MRPARVAALAAAAAAALATPALAAVIADVTLRARMFVNEGTQTREVELSGTVSSGAAGEHVEVLSKECGPFHQFYRVVAGATTTGGGSWQIVSNRAPNYLRIPVPAYFRARWRGNESEPVLVRIPALVFINWRPRLRRLDAWLSNWTSGQNFRGRFVELQRKLPGTDQWVRVRRARLGAGTRGDAYAGLQFRTHFRIPTRGLTLRVLAPEATGAPCFSAGVSGEFRS